MEFLTKKEFLEETLNPGILLLVQEIKSFIQQLLFCHNYKITPEIKIKCN